MAREGGTPLGGAVLVTGNTGKVAEARRLVPGLEHVAIDLPEIQSLDYREVLRAKADEAWRRLGRPLVVEEAGLEIVALSAFPGPLVKWMLEAIGAEGIAQMAIRLGDGAATARCLLLHRDGEGDTIAEGESRGLLVDPPRGERGFGWDPIFLPDGSEATYAELEPDAKLLVSHRGRAWRALLEALDARA